MGYELTVNQEQVDKIPELSQEAEYKHEENISQDELIEEIKYLIYSKNMDNWNLAGYLLLLASKHFPSDLEIEEDYRNSKGACLFPGYSLKEYEKLIGRKSTKECHSKLYSKYKLGLEKYKNNRLQPRISFEYNY